MQNYLVNSKKSSTFAPAFGKIEKILPWQNNRSELKVSEK